MQIGKLYPTRPRPGASQTIQHQHSDKLQSLQSQQEALQTTVAGIASPTSGNFGATLSGFTGTLPKTSGQYFRIGDFVFFTISLTAGNFDSNQGTSKIALPFMPKFPCAATCCDRGVADLGPCMIRPGEGYVYTPFFSTLSDSLIVVSGCYIAVPR